MFLPVVYCKQSLGNNLRTFQPFRVFFVGTHFCCTLNVSHRFLNFNRSPSSCPFWHTPKPLNFQLGLYLQQVLLYPLFISLPLYPKMFCYSPFLNLLLCLKRPFICPTSLYTSYVFLYFWGPFIHYTSLFASHVPLYLTCPFILPTFI